MSSPAAELPAEHNGHSREFVQSLERGLSVLRTFTADAPALSLSDVARRADLTRATARRLLHTFESLGYMRSQGKLFELTPKVLDLGYAYVSSLRLPDIAQPYMEELSERVNESVSAAVLDGNDIVYVARVPTKHIMSISLGIGSRLPATTTSMGRVLLAELPESELECFLKRVTIEARTTRTIVDAEALHHELAEIRRLGYAINNQELEDSVRSVAVPLRDGQKRAIAALNIGTHAGRVSLRDLRATMLPELLRTAAQINAGLARR